MIVGKFVESLTNLICSRSGSRSVSVHKSKKRMRVAKFKAIEKMKKATEKMNKAGVKRDPISFKFSEEGKEVLTNFFYFYPPGEHGEAEKTATTSSKNSGNTRKTDDILCKPIMKKAEIAKKLESVTARMESDLKLKQVLFIFLFFF